MDGNHPQIDPEFEFPALLGRESTTACVTSIAVGVDPEMCPVSFH